MLRIRLKRTDARPRAVRGDGEDLGTSLNTADHFKPRHCVGLRAIGEPQADHSFRARPFVLESHVRGAQRDDPRGLRVVRPRPMGV